MYENMILNNRLIIIFSILMHVLYWLAKYIMSQRKTSYCKALSNPIIQFIEDMVDRIVALTTDYELF